eukprot:15198335-Alexandrium_andersonii.AAC.1
MTSASGRQVLHTLRRTRGRSPGQVELGANSALNSVQRVRGGYEGVEAFHLAWSSRARRAQTSGADMLGE